MTLERETRFWFLVSGAGFWGTGNRPTHKNQKPETSPQKPETGSVAAATDFELPNAGARRQKG
jgi:hypothetical protein